jgi:FAD:protein FMN transferase
MIMSRLRFRAFITHPVIGRKPLARILSVGGSTLLATAVLWGCTSSPKVYTRSQLLMGTTVEITAVSTDEAKAYDAMTAAFGEIRRLENLLSTYIPASELSRVNQAAGINPVAVSLEVLYVVQEALRIAQLTEGGFNIAIGPAIDLWRVTDQPRIPTASELGAVRLLIQYENIKWDEKDRTIFLTQKGMRIDVGGIGKGYAADQAEAILRRSGIDNGIIAVAGDIKAFGRKPDRTAWNIAIQHPRRQDIPLAELDLENEAVSTSGDYERVFMKEGRRYHHILDPMTLQPADRSQSVTVVAKQGIFTDALSTGIFVMGPEKGMALLEQLPGVEGVIVDAQGRVSVSSGLKSRLKLYDSTG